ncbi:MAG: hypothetical protein WCF20_04360 [Methylovirgula sp.]
MALFKGAAAAGRGERRRAGALSPGSSLREAKCALLSMIGVAARLAALDNLG